MPDNSPLLLAIIAVVGIVAVVGVVGTVGMVGIRTAPSKASATGLTTASFPFGCYQTTPAAVQTNFTLKFGNKTIPIQANSTKLAGWQTLPDTACANRIAVISGKEVSAWMFRGTENIFVKPLNGCYVSDVYSNPEDKVRILVPKQTCPIAPPPGGTLLSDDFSGASIDTSKWSFPFGGSEFWSIIDGRACSTAVAPITSVVSTPGASITVKSNVVGIPRSISGLDSFPVVGLVDFSSFTGYIVALVNIDGVSSGLFVVRVTDGSGGAILLDSVPSSISLRIADGVVEGYADGILYITISNTSPPVNAHVALTPAGPLGFSGLLPSCFDNVVLTSP